MMLEVIEPNWLEMEAAITSPSSEREQTVDDIVEVHNKFLFSTLEACLLTNRDLVRCREKGVVVDVLLDSGRGRVVVMFCRQRLAHDLKPAFVSYQHRSDPCIVQVDENLFIVF